MSNVPKYPLPYDPSDDRLDEDLVGLVADLIAFRTGYPHIDGPDLERLRQALRWFLYRDDLGGDFDRSQSADADATPAPVASRRYPAHYEDARTGEVIETQPGRVLTHYASSRCRRPGRTTQDWADVTCDLCLLDRPVEETGDARPLARHGYPPITAGGDFIALQQALFGFLYGTGRAEL